MNALVNYASDSDEHDAVAEPKASSGSTRSRVENPRHTLSRFPQPPVNEGNGSIVGQQQLVGPTMSCQNGMHTLEDSESDQDYDRELQSLSESEKLRYLTRPSHPMDFLPPSPPGSPDPAMEQKFERFLRLKENNSHFNEDLAQKGAFKNPNLLSMLMGRAGLSAGEQYGTSLPPDVFEASMFPSSAYKEELLKSQQLISAQVEDSRRELSRAGKRIVEFTNSTTLEDLRKALAPGLDARRKAAGG